MAPSSSQLKGLIADFVEATGASERTANKYLKSAGYRLNDAVESFFVSSGVERKSALDGQLNTLFDQLRDDQNDEKDKMELESTMEYFGSKLGVSLENAEFLVAVELVESPSVGEITRAGFIKGWNEARCEPTIKAQAAHLQQLISQLSKDTALFKKVYRHTFNAGREKDQKALSLETALAYWGTLFAAPGWEWKSANHDWLELWKSFLEEKWSRSVNKDMWNMILEFALKSSQDENLSFWNEDGAWPSVVDDFVEWCKAKGIGKSESMEVDN